MEPYQYWTIAGFAFLLMEFTTLKIFPLALTGALFFAAVIAFKFPNDITLQVLTFFVFIPVFLLASKPYKKTKGE